MSSPDHIIVPDLLVIVALGSNLASNYGSSQATVLQAFEELQSLVKLPIVRSSLWRTAPSECEAGTPDFVNAVAALHMPNGADPHALLDTLLSIESEFGRVRNSTGNSRTLDLDLICFGDQVIETERLTLPHPRAYSRRFVLKPLAEIEPDLRLPGQSLTVYELEKHLTEQGLISLLSS
jgi:2-amino-4-hydroxy-6-hydroxymethyldihydropteridine diphosphokinase